MCVSKDIALTRFSSALRLVVLFCALPLGSCAYLPLPGGTTQPFNPLPPGVEVEGVTLAAMPSNNQIVRYLCDTYVPSPANLLACPAFGPAVRPEQMNFAFDLELSFDNPNQVPLPVVQALVAFTAYPEQSAQNLGALCVSFCEQPSSCPQDAAGACQSNEPEIRDMESFAGAAAGFLLRAATGQAQLEDLRLRTVAPGGTAHLVIRLELAPTEMVRLLRQTGENFVGQIRQGQVPSLAIDYRIEGSAWVSIENFGRIAVNFGPVDGAWDLPVDALVGSR